MPKGSWIFIIGCKPVLCKPGLRSVLWVSPNLTMPDEIVWVTKGGDSFHDMIYAERAKGHSHLLGVTIVADLAPVHKPELLKPGLLKNQIQ